MRIWSSRIVAALPMALIVTAGLSSPVARGQEITTTDLETAAADPSA